MSIKYRKGYKYQLAEDLKLQTSFTLAEDIITPRIELYTSGTLIIRDAYAYDGPSGPVIDRKTNMRGAAGHDALYQLMRMGLIAPELWRIADKDFGTWMSEDGAWGITVRIDLAGLKIAGGRAALPKNRKRVYTAP
jgi:hypothetical protein